MNPVLNPSKLFLIYIHVFSKRCFRHLESQCQRSQSSLPTSGRQGVRVTFGKPAIPPHALKVPTSISLFSAKMSSTTIPLGVNLYQRAPDFYYSFVRYLGLILRKAILPIPRMVDISSPRGKDYAYNQAQEGITFVTEAHVLEPGVSDQLDGWMTGPDSRSCR